MSAAEEEQPRDWSGIAAVFLVVAAALSAAAAVAALSGADALERNVREVETRTGLEIYAGLGTWGVILLFAAVAEVVGAFAIWRGTPHRILLGQAVAYFGLGASFFSLVVIRLPGIPAMVLLSAAIYVLTYRSGPRPREF